MNTIFNQSAKSTAKIDIPGLADQFFADHFFQNWVILRKPNPLAQFFSDSIDWLIIWACAYVTNFPADFWLHSKLIWNDHHDYFESEFILLINFSNQFRESILQKKTLKEVTVYGQAELSQCCQSTNISVFN